ncbi:MAG: flagellar biosynthesis protein FlhA [Zetaproteobacteria bacterium]|nr:MAG: flagellar biosynthesis protein FlhA [Zetaproteobacteria bacterium]
MPLRLRGLARHTDVLLAGGVLLVLLVMMVPLPLWLMDVLLAVNLSIGIVILLTSLYILKPLEFSSFPTILLLTTLFRLSLNVATTRLILLHGQEGPQAAGHIIEGFGQFVVGGNTVVGIIIFLILVLINFVVITKGSTRIAEVAARFTLDAMPGKQMAIDADLNAGLIDEETAKARRQEVARESEFYGAMDGAAKFVRGDAVAGLIITAINLVAGMIIGSLQQGMPLSEAMDVYSILTVGDGLVSQIPALVISTAAGIVITRAGAGDTIQVQLGDQFTRYPKLYYVASGAVAMLSLVPGFPFVPFILLSVGLGIIGWYLQGETEKREAEAQQQALAAEPEAAPGRVEEAPLSDLLVVDPIRIEVGYGLIDMVEGRGEGNLLDRLQSIRRQLTEDMGFILPPVHIKDNLQLGVGDYRVLIRGAEVARSEIRPRNLLALEGNLSGPPVQGVATREPAFGLPALWIGPEQRQQAEISGYTVVEPSTVIITHITEVLRKHAHEMLDRVQVMELVDALKERHPKVVEEMVPNPVSIGLLQNVLRRLLAEWVPIRDLLLIIETLADAMSEPRDLTTMVEMVRMRLGRTIVARLVDEQGELHVLTIDGEIEQMMTERVSQQGASLQLPLEINYWQRFVTRLNDLVASRGIDAPVLLTSATLRYPLANALLKVMDRITVLSIAEVPPDMVVQADGTVSLRDG